jgi:nucleoid DNA-binding protein
MAAHRGWLDYDWDRVADDRNTTQRQQPEQVIEEVTKAVSEKLVIHHDVLMDENGQRVEPPRQSKAGRKKKMMEVNETQISKFPLNIVPKCHALPRGLFVCVCMIILTIESSQSKAGLAFRPQATQETYL